MIANHQVSKRVHCTSLPRIEDEKLRIILCIYLWLTVKTTTCETPIIGCCSLQACPVLPPNQKPHNDKHKENSHGCFFIVFVCVWQKQGMLVNSGNPCLQSSDDIHRDALYHGSLKWEVERVWKYKFWSSIEYQVSNQFQVWVGYRFT